MLGSLLFHLCYGAIVGVLPILIVTARTLMSPDGVSYIPRQFTSIMRSFVLLVLKRFWFSMFYHLHFGLFFFVCCCNLLVTVMFGMRIYVS